MGRFGGLGSSLNLYGSDYYLFYGLGEEGYIGTISKFSITEQVKESELAKKKREKLQHLMISTELSSSSDEDLHF